MLSILMNSTSFFTICVFVLTDDKLGDLRLVPPINLINYLKYAFRLSGVTCITSDGEADR